MTLLWSGGSRKRRQAPWHLSHHRSFQPTTLPVDVRRRFAQSRTSGATFLFAIEILNPRSRPSLWGL